MPRKTYYRPSPLGKMVERYLLETGLNQAELAELVGHGMTQGAIHNIVRGKTQTIQDRARLEALGRVIGKGSVEEFVLAAYAPHTASSPRRERQEPAPTAKGSKPYLVGGSMDFQFRGDEIVVRDPSPSVRRIVEHLGALSERAHLALERTLLDMREEEADVDGEEAAEAAQADRRTGTKEATR